MFAPATTPPRFATLVLLTAASVLSLNMFLPSLANISVALEAEYALVSLSVSGYLAVTAVLQVVLGPLSDRFGRRPVLLVGVTVFALASVVCALAQDIWLFLGFRVLQGAIISGFAISAAVIRDTTDGAEAASRMGYVGMSMAVAPMLAPMLGGLLDEVFGWRANFWFYAALGCGLIWLVWADLGETNRNRAATMAEQMREYPELLRSRRFWGYSACAAFGVGAFYIFVAGAPFVATARFGLSPAQVGIGIGSITGGFFVGSFLSGRFSARIGLIGMVMAGRVVAVAGMGAGLLLYALGVFTPLSFFGAAVSVGLGNGLTVPNARTGAMSVRPHLAGSAAGLSGALTVAGGAVLTALPSALLTVENAGWLQMALMLGAALAGLAAAFYIRAVDRAEAAASPGHPTQG